MASIRWIKLTSDFIILKLTLPTDTISQFLALVLETLLYGIFLGTGDISSV